MDTKRYTWREDPQSRSSASHALESSGIGGANHKPHVVVPVPAVKHDASTDNPHQKKVRATAPAVRPKVTKTDGVTQEKRGKLTRKTAVKTGVRRREEPRTYVL